MARSKRQHGSLDDAVQSGCIMTEYHRHENNENFTVHVKGADGQTFVYTNVGQEHMKNLLMMVGIKEPGIPKDHWTTPEYEAFVSGQAESGKPSPQVHVQQKGGAEMTQPGQVSGGGRATRSTTGGSQGSSEGFEGPARTAQGGLTFVECVRQGAKLVDYHLTDRGTYAVHMQTPDGIRRAYSSISREHIEKLDGFEGD